MQNGSGSVTYILGSTNKTNIILWLWLILRNKKNVAFTLVISELTWIMFTAWVDNVQPKCFLTLN